MKKLLLSFVAVVAAFAANATDTVLWQGKQEISWNQSCVVAASKCANMQANQQIIVEYNCLESATYYSLGLIKGWWGDWPDKIWSTGGVSKGTTSKAFDIPEGNLATLKTEGFFLMGNGLEVTRIIWRDEVRDKSVLLDNPLVITTASEGITFTYDELVAAGAEQCGGVQVEFEAADGGYINYMHQGSESNEYEWCEFSQPQVSESEGKSILILNKATLDEINTFGKTLVIQAGYVTVNRVKVIKPIEVPGTSIVISQSEAELMAGKTLQLSATTNPEGQKITWSSSDEAIATVDYNGLVTAVAEGTATITAAAGTGTATCTLKVTPAAAIILKWVNKYREEVYGDAVDIEGIANYGETPRLMVTTIPENASISFSTSSEPSTAAKWYEYKSSKQAEVSLKGAGVATIVVKLTGYPDVEATASVTIKELESPELKFGFSDKNSTDFSELGAMLAGSVVNLSVNIMPDNDYDLEDSYYDNFDYEWTSSDPAVATVSGESYNKKRGVITALSAGTTTITAKIGDGTTVPVLEKSIDVTVVNSGKLSYVFNFNTPNRGSSYDWKQNYNLPDGTTEIDNFIFAGKSAAGLPLVDLVPSAGTVSPLVFAAASTLTFSVADPYVRIESIGVSSSSTAVDGNKVFDVTATEGTVEGASWTAATEGGVPSVVLTAASDIATASMPYWHVGLFRYAVPESAAISEESIKGKETETVQLTATYAPADALPGLTFTWSSADEAVATVDETGLVTLCGEGTTTLTATLEAPMPAQEGPEVDCKLTLTATCNVEVEPLSGIEDVVIDMTDASVEVFNLHGIRVDAANLAPGIYIVRQGAKTSKVLVK